MTCGVGGRGLVEAAGALVLAFAAGGCATPEKWVECEDFEQRFEQAGVDGVFLAYEERTECYLTNDEERAHRAFIPASTYKIFNSLVALETGVVADENEVLAWDGVDRGWSRWNQDHNLRSAIQYSTVWFYQELARRIGEERMQQYVDAAGYGNRDIDGGIDVFWLQGDLRISPYQQVEFLRRLRAGDLPFSSRTMEIVRDILILEREDGFVLRAKTGWGQRMVPEVGWFVGYVEHQDRGPVFFATNLDIREEGDARARVAVTRQILGDLGRLAE